MDSTVVACSIATRSASTAVSSGSCSTSTPWGLPLSMATETRRSPSRIGAAAFTARRSRLSQCSGGSLG